MAWFLSMEVWQQALLASLAMYFMTALGASFVLFARRPKEGVFTLLLGLSAGIMIAASFSPSFCPPSRRRGGSPHTSP